MVEYARFLPFLPDIDFSVVFGHFILLLVKLFFSDGLDSAVANNEKHGENATFLFFGGSDYEHSEEGKKRA